MINRIVLNETSYFGRGSREKVIEELKSRNLKRVLIVTDHNLVENKVINMVTKYFDIAGISYMVFDDVKPNPTVDIVKEGVQLAKNHASDSIVAVGGGSPIDTAKAIGIILANPEFSDVVSLDGVAATKNKAVPIIALPTTAGTAAEVTINYVITDPQRVKKMVCVDVHDIPVVAIVDPELMEGMPKSIAASTGMDALTHAMEGYLTRAAWLMTDMFHMNAMSLIYNNLEKAVNDKDEKAIDQVAYGQYIAGMGFSNVGLGIVHSMAHSLGAYFDTPHGIANAILLPHVLKFNGQANPELYRNMGGAFGIDMSNTTDEEAVNKVVDAVKDLSKRVGIPENLSQIGITKEMIPTLAKQAINDVCTPGNPRNVTVEDIIKIYEEAYN